MLKTVTGECHPFSDDWLTQLDKMTKEKAIAWVQMYLDSAIDKRNRYEQGLLQSRGQDFEKYLHVWCIDNNNIVRFRRLILEIEAE